MHYFPQFTVWTTDNSKMIKWDKDDQLLYWYPSTQITENYLIIAKGKITDLAFDNAPPKIKDKVSKTKKLVISNFE
jgi:hypothetical protein